MDLQQGYGKHLTPVRTLIFINMEERIDKAVELFMSGYGCCQSVVGAFADLYALSHEQAMAVAAGFGGGVGRMRMMCGAVSGLVILAGLSCGQTKADDRMGKANCYKVVQELLAKFKERNGSLICAELLGLKGDVPHTNYVPAERNAHYYKTRPCAAKVESAARIFAEWLEENKG
jgi:C_GCAxxG_C_C family probable redox protein